MKSIYHILPCRFNGGVYRIGAPGMYLPFMPRGPKAQNSRLQGGMGCSAEQYAEDRVSVASGLLQVAEGFVPLSFGYAMQGPDDRAQLALQGQRLPVAEQRKPAIIGNRYTRKT